MKKTLNFAAIHFSIALTIAYILTGDFILGSFIAMVEPMVNTVAFYFHEKVWEHYPSLKSKTHLTKVKTISFAIVHFSVAFSVIYLMTGDVLIGGAMGMIEPCINTCVYYFYEKLGQRKATFSIPHLH